MLKIGFKIFFNKGRYTLEQAYTRYEWALNFLDRSRWDEGCVPKDTVEEMLEESPAGLGGGGPANEIDMSDLCEV